MQSEVTGPAEWTPAAEQATGREPEHSGQMGSTRGLAERVTQGGLTAQFSTRELRRIPLLVSPPRDDLTAFCAH